MSWRGKFYYWMFGGDELPWGILLGVGEWTRLIQSVEAGCVLQDIYHFEKSLWVFDMDVWCD